MDLRLCGKIAFQIINGKPIQWHDITTELREIYSEAFKMEASKPIRPSNKDKFTLVFFEASDTDSALVGSGPEYFVVSITMDDNIYTL